jgi:hypothetical protein
MLLFQNNSAQLKSQVYTPECEVGSEIIFRVDMKDGCMKLDAEPLLDENGNGISFRFYALAFKPFFGDIGLSSNYDWIKVLMIPTSKHPLIEFSKLTVCSMYLRGDSRNNFLHANSQAPAKGIDVTNAIMQTTFGRVEKSSVGAGQKVTTRPAVFKFVQPEGDEVTAIKIFQKELPNHQEKIISLLSYNSGNSLIELLQDGKDNERKESFRQGKTIAGSNETYYLPAAEVQTNGEVETANF